MGGPQATNDFLPSTLFSLIESTLNGGKFVSQVCQLPSGVVPYHHIPEQAACIRMHVFTIACCEHPHRIIYTFRVITRYFRASPVDRVREVHHDASGKDCLLHGPIAVNRGRNQGDPRDVIACIAPASVPQASKQGSIIIS